MIAEKRVLRRRACAGTAALTLVLGVAACGTSESSQVRSKVQEFAAAVHDHDYATICTDVLAPQLLADIAAGGVSCDEALKLGLSKVSGARLLLTNINVSGSTASVLTVSQATGEKTTLATLELTHTAKGWRIVSLGDAAET